MTTCLLSVMFLGPSAAQAIAADDLVEQCPSVVTEPVCLPDPTTMQQLLGESAVTSGRGIGKISRQKNYYDLAKGYKYSIQVYNTVLLFSFAQIYENMKSNEDWPAITSTSVY